MGSLYQLDIAALLEAYSRQVNFMLCGEHRPGVSSGRKESEQIEVKIDGWRALSRGVVGDDRELVALPGQQGGYKLSFR